MRRTPRLPWVRAGLRLPGLLAGHLVPPGATAPVGPRVAERPGPPRTRLRIDPLSDRFGIRVIGEVDLCTRERWERALDETVVPNFDVHFDLSALTFTDAAGVALLVAATERVSEGRHLVVHRPPRGWLLIFELFWPSGVPTVEVMCDEHVD